MELNWLDDLVALVEAESLTLAAQRRNITQPAFTRRIQQIEQWLGTPVLDRSRRPARVTQVIRRKLEDIRSLTFELRKIRGEIQSWDDSQRRLAIAAQHSIAVGVLPRFIAQLQDAMPAASIRLRSANRDECHSLLLTRQVAMTMVYESENLPLAADETLLEKVALRQETLCAVAVPAIANSLAATLANRHRLPVVAFPPDVFLGAVVARGVMPDLQERYRVHIACETALVPAVLELALAGVGVAWLPHLSCLRYLQSGALVDVSDRLGSVPMKLVLARTTTPHTSLAEAVWNRLGLISAAGGAGTPGNSAAGVLPPFAL